MYSMLVTGGCGFIGSHLTSKLISSNQVERVIIVDNMMMGSKDNLDEEVQKNVQIYNMDVANRESISFLIQKHRIDTVIHLAVTPLVMSLKEPVFTFKSIVDMQASILECQRQGLFDRLVSFSTTEVYGDAGYNTVVNELTACHPRTTYAAAKAAADYLIFSYAATFNINYTILRPVNNFGPRKRVLDGAGIIPTTIRRIVEGKPVVLFNNGQQIRNFLNVKDTVRATMNVLENDKVINQVFLLADSMPRTMVDVVKDLYEIIGAKENIIYTSPRKGDVEMVQADPTKAKNVLGFQPMVPWKEGLQECVDYYSSHQLV